MDRSVHSLLKENNFMMRLEDVLSEYKIPATEVERQYYFIDVAKQILEDKEKEAGRKLTFCVNTFGCPIVRVKKTL